MSLTFIYIGDAPLTQEGLIQSFNVQTMWTTENSLREGTAGIGIPQISYCSPLARCLETHTVSFASLLGAAGGPAIITKVYEVHTLSCLLGFPQSGH